VQFGDVTIIRLQNPADAAAYRASFVGAYQTVWSQPPYNEEFYPYEAEAVLKRQLQGPGHITLLAVRGISTVVGFGFAVPLRSREDVAREMTGLLPPAHTMYLAELGILPEWRKKGLGSAMIDERLRLVDGQTYTHCLLRTSTSIGYELYSDRGFEDMGVYMEVQSRRTDGSVSTDRRLFLSKVL
jgi:GNAT superfamily N-acetyltransferase